MTFPAKINNVTFVLIGILNFIYLSGSTQPVTTFEMTLGGQTISELNRIPGSTDFYASGTMVYKTGLLFNVLRIDTAGKIKQQKQYDVPGFKLIDRCRVTGSGGLLILGHSSPTVNNIFCLSVAEDGNTNWNKSFSLPAAPIAGVDVVEASDGSILISGTVYVNYYSDAFLMKITRDGDLVWCKRFRESIGREATGGCILAKGDTAIFFTGVETVRFIGTHNIRINKLSMLDGSLYSQQEITTGDEVGFEDLELFDNQDGGYYLATHSFIYRTPIRNLYILKFDADFNLVDNYHIENSTINYGFGVVDDGIIEIGCNCNGYSSNSELNNITKVSSQGQVSYAVQYPETYHSTAVRIERAIQIGDKLFLSGSKNDKGFITALNSFYPLANNCSLADSRSALLKDNFYPADGEWQSIMDETVNISAIPGSVVDLQLTPEFATCAASPVLFVDQFAIGKNDGSSWQDALNSLADAIEKLNTTSYITTLLVAKGDYNLSAQPFMIDKLNAKLLGGFPHGGGERDPETQPVILHGVVRFKKSAELDGFHFK